MNDVKNSKVADVFLRYPEKIRVQLLKLRQLISETASTTPGVGELEESLKWGDPAYLTEQSKSGSTIRLGWNNRQPDQYAIYFNCHTTLVETFKALFADRFRYEGNRAIIFAEEDDIPERELCHCIAIALTYHLKKGSSHLSG